jgi:4-hydroxythreonine-4-phosphate dehydrogenase
MVNSRLKKKYVFLGDVNSINIEIIIKSFKSLKYKIQYILIGSKKDLIKYLIKINSNISVNEINDPIDFKNFDKNYLNIFNIENISKFKYLNLINQIKISNFLSSKTNIDLVTMPINKSIFKKKINFNGITEFLGELNYTKTIMMMMGNNFSVIPYTTHINPKFISKSITERQLNNFFKRILKILNNQKYFHFKKINFICYNPHCGEDGTMGNEDIIIKKTMQKYKMINGPFSADSAFSDIKNKALYITTYHDQGLIPFKALNDKKINITLGLNYKRLSPAHGTAQDIKFKDKADISSYLSCMMF